MMWLYHCDVRAQVLVDGYYNNNDLKEKYMRLCHIDMCEQALHEGLYNTIYIIM